MLQFVIWAYCYRVKHQKKISSSVSGLSVMTPRECRVDRPFPVTWLGNLWEPFPPPPRSTGLSRLFNPRFPGLKIRYRLAVTWTCDWHTWFSFICNLITIDTTPPSTTASLEPRLSVFSFFNRGAFFGGLPFALLVLQFKAVQALFSLSKLSWESSPLFGALAPRLAASAVAHWCDSRTVPWPLVWDSWPSLSFALTDQPPPPYHLKNHLIWEDSIQVIPLACCMMYLERLVGTHKFLITLVILSFQVWS